MFSHLKNAVEQLAHQVPVPGTDNGNDQRRGSGEISRSMSPLSSGQLAESARANLRKSLSQQRSQTPERTNGNGRNSASPASGTAGSAERPRKTTLEERLRRATAAAISEHNYPLAPVPSSISTPASSTPASSSATPPPDTFKDSTAKATTEIPSPSSSRRPSRTNSTSRDLGIHRPQSPASVPLPQSPALRPSKLVEVAPSTEISTLDLGASKTHDFDTGEKEAARNGGEKAVDVSAAVDTEDTPEPVAVGTAPSAEEVGFSVDEKLKDFSLEAVSEAPAPNTTPSFPQPSPPSDAPPDSGTKETPLDSESAPIPPAKDPAIDTDSNELPPPEPTATSADAKPTAEGTRGLIEAPEEKLSESPVVLEPQAKSPEPTVEVLVQKAKDEAPAKGAVVEELHQRLKQVEQRFADVSTSFKRLQAEKRAADAVLRQFTPLETIQDDEGLSDYLKNIQSKIMVSRDEINRLNSKLEDYEHQLEDLRNVHLSETSSKSDEISKLRIQLRETEALFNASEQRITQLEESLSAQQTSSSDYSTQLDKLRAIAKEEEEKRVKAISLLKTVRQKLVKTEKERDEALQRAKDAKDGESQEVERERNERMRLAREVEALQVEKDKTLLAQKAQFDRELALAKEKADKELAAVKGQLELDIITLKASHSKELASKNSQISTLENSLNNVSRDKNSFFEQLQIKQAETESAQGHLESLQHQNSELEFQLRETNDRLALLREEYTEYQREQEARAREPTTSPDEIAQMIAVTEGRYEAKLAELRRNLEVLEKERGESESNWSRKLREKTREVEELNRMLGSTAKEREEGVGTVEKLRSELIHEREEVRRLREEMVEMSALRDKIDELKINAKEQEKDMQLHLAAIEKQFEDSKTRETQLKQANKTLKDELRKVQSSAALLERQRNPGVGYWNRPEESGSQSASTVSPGPPASPVPRKEEEEVNLEYLRNVVLQFLEHKEMRPNLVKVISIILRFTPQETRRLMAKV